MIENENTLWLCTEIDLCHWLIVKHFVTHLPVYHQSSTKEREREREREREMYLSVIIKSIGSTQSCINLFLGQVLRAFVKNFSNKKLIIWRQLWFPHKISPRSATKSTVQSCQFTDLRWIQVHKNGWDTILWQVTKTRFRWKRASIITLCSKTRESSPHKQ